VNLKLRNNGGTMFYLEKRDGLAKLGKLEYEEFKIETPCLLKFGSEILEKFDYGKAPYPVKKIAPELYEKLKPAEQEIKILTGLNTLSPRDFVKSLLVTELRPVFAVAAATSLNLPLLVYLGIDIVDNILAISKAYEGVYFLPGFELSIEDLEKLPCRCEICREYSVSELKKLEKEEMAEIIAKHNTVVLENEVEKCRVLIRKEELRNYVEAMVKLNPELTAMLRLSDFSVTSSHTGVCKFFPRFKRSKCLFATMESSYRFEVRYFLKRVFECYRPETRTLLLLPCTATKPYLVSPTHRELRRRVEINISEIIISSPLVVPREFELIYPASNYDTPVTGHWSDEEVAFVSSWLAKFIEKGNFEKIIAHVEGGYRRVVEKAVEGYEGVEIVYTAEEGILSHKAITKLKQEIEKVRTEIPKFDLFTKIFESMFNYQFGTRVDELYEIFGGVEVRGRYPDLEFYIRTKEKKKRSEKDRIARIDVSTGSLDIYSQIAAYLIGRGIYTVRIADFEPKSKVFASGVIEAHYEIRPNDVIVFHNENIYGVGVAVMSGEEMVERDAGLAFRVRRMWSWESENWCMKNKEI
jgi:archaeosine synthase